MASIHKDPRGKSPYWYAAFYGADGRRKFRSTRTTDRRVALKLGTAWDDSAKKARRGELTAAQARKVLAEFVAATSGETLDFHTVEGWLGDWLKNKAGGATPATMARYKQVIRDFLLSMGARRSAPLGAVSPTDIVRFRDLLRKEGRAVSTCNTVVKKVLSVSFEAARKLGYIPTNPVAAVDLLKDRGETRRAGREPFTLDDLKRLLEAARGDWQGAIILAATSGLRLGDVANLTWTAIDREAGLARVQTEKTDALVVLPLHPDFLSWLASQRSGVGMAPVFPDLAGKRLGGCNGLSAIFRKLMVEANIGCRVVEREGKGRTGHSKGFHSLRHTFVSSLANAGVAPDIRQKLAGHADAKVHAAYTHHEIQTLRTAVATLPRILSA